MSNLNRDIKYINKDFTGLKNRLVEFTKTYYPDTFNDFSDSSTGALFIEMAAYVGDVLSFYIDNQIQETFIQRARQINNLFDLAYLLGYRPKVTTAATVDIDFFQQVPAKIVGSERVPDYSYAITVPENTIVTNTTSTTPFTIEDPIDFAHSSSLDLTEVSVYSISSGQPEFFLIKKTRRAISSTINTTSFEFGEPQKFATRNLNATNIISVLDVFDSDNNEYYEVPNLAQESIFDSIKNTNPNDPNYSNDNEVPFLLKLKKVQRRFTTRFLNKTNLQFEFGAGTTNDNDEEIVPNPNNVGLGLPFEQNKLTTAFSPTNFVLTDTYGIAPSNTTLTVRYLTGGGASSNVSAGTLTNITNLRSIKFNNSTFLNQTLANTVFGSIVANNPRAASGGSSGDTPEVIRKNALGNFQNQLRTVTPQDYLVRTLSLPPRFGVISKAYTTPSLISTRPTPPRVGQNRVVGTPTSNLDLYILSLDINEKLAIASNTVKNNLRTYLEEYRTIGDSINIKDAFIINIGIEFEIITLPNFNNSEVLTNCINALTNYFNTDNFQINEPIILSQLYITLDKISGVQTVKNIKIVNKTQGVYSGTSYDIEGATINNVVYPSIDPMIFELKFPQNDIKGRVVPL